MKKLTLFAKTALTISALALLPQTAQAWGTNGHRVTGKIADNYIAEETRAAITDILGVESIAEASTWPDFMRSAPGEYWRKETPPWHFVTVPPGQTYASAEKPAGGDAVIALRHHSATLKDPKAAREQRQLALRFVIHIIEDLHQPLHNGNGRDQGGNQVKVLFMDKETNLHSVWDEGMLDAEKLSYSEKARWLTRRITNEERAKWTDINPQTWIAESVVMRNRVYPFDPANPPSSDYPAIPNLSYDYIYKHTADMNLRLKQGGVRLAAYLDDLFGG